jgi:hypothetical protein
VKRKENCHVDRILTTLVRLEQTTNPGGKSKELPNDGCSRYNDIFLAFAGKRAFPLLCSVSRCKLDYRRQHHLVQLSEYFTGLELCSRCADK